MPSPNVLFIFTDQHRADMLGCAGSPYVATPHLDRIARDGVRFTQARCTTPLCMPSRTTYFTGRSARSNGTLWNEIRLRPDGEHLTTRLREAGYALALAGKNHVFPDDELRLWDFVELYGMHGKEVTDYTSPARPGEEAVAAWRQHAIPFFEAPVHEPQPGPPEDDPAVAQTDHAIRFLTQERPQDRPFFLWLSFEAPHFPYVLPEPWFSRYRPDAMPGSLDGDLWQAGPPRLEMQRAGLRMDEMDEDDIRRVQATYCGMITLVDEQVGRVLATLREQHLEDDTIVVFASDHGDFWGHRGLIGKTNAVYEDLLRIPMLWRIPGLPAERTSDALVENTDFTPTLLDLLDLPPLPAAEGISFAPILQGWSQSHRQESFAESSLGLPSIPAPQLYDAIAQRESLLDQEGPFWFVNRLGGLTRSIYQPPYKLIVHEMGGMELYNLEDDPSERDNLASRAHPPAILTELACRLEQTPADDVLRSALAAN